MSADGAFDVMTARIADGLSERELDDLPFGAIQVDADGVVLRYNRLESELSGMAAQSVVGRNFFTEVAPCTQVAEFAGRFREGVERGQLRTAFPFVFDFESGKVRVTVSLVYRGELGAGWIFVTRRQL